MELINHTNYPAMLFRSIVEKDYLITSVIVRVTYDIKDDKVLPSPTQDWLLHNGPWESEYGPMESDRIFRMGGVDILAFGKARAKNKTAVKEMEVKVKLENKLSHSIIVFGNRFWEKNIFGIRIGDPDPFTEMPLTLYNAFGGKAEWDGLPIPYANNIYGKGFYWEKEEAINRPLPNIENPKNLIYEWNHRPDPVGFVTCPMNELRMRRNIEYDKKTYQIKNIAATFFNTAFPEMIVSDVKPGERIVVSGMTSEGNFVFKIPEHSLNVKITIGKKRNERLLKIDQVGVIPDKQQAFINYRFPFRYKFEPLEIRKCELFEKN